jgi:hypothetical protein
LDKAGNYSAWVISNGITINTSVGTVGVISDNGGIDNDRDFSDGNRLVEFSWSDLADSSGYKIQIFETTTSESDDYQGLKNVGALTPDPGTNTLITGVTLTTIAGTTTFGFTGQDGKVYYIKVKAYDTAGNESSIWVKSDAITVDITPPDTTAAVVLDTASGIVYPGEYVNNTTVNFNWSGFSDPGSQISYYQVQSSDDNSNWSTTQNVGLITNLSTNGYDGETFGNGEIAYLRVRAVDKAGNQSTWIYSDGIMIDTDAADVSGVTPFASKVSARRGSIDWEEALDIGGSGIDYYIIEITHSNAPVCYFTVKVNAARTTVSDITEYYSTSVVNQTLVNLDASSPKKLEFTWDVVGATADFVTAIVRVYDKAGNVSQSYMSNEFNVW